MSQRGGKRDIERPKPVKKIILPEKFPGWRLLAAILFAAVGAAALTYAFAAYFHMDSGWRTIEVPASAQANCSEEFSFQYYLGDNGVSASAEYRNIVALYTEAAVRAHRLFHNNQGFDGVHNIYYINQHPNEIIEVDEVLYQAFQTLQDYGSRWLYLGPVYAEYTNLFYCNDDSETQSYDPYQSAETAAYFAEIAAYAQNPAKIDIQLMENHQIKLSIADDYLAYAEETGFTGFIDFFSLKNAFIIDYLAEVMRSNHYTSGYLSSYDGFVRNLDDGETAYSYQLYDRVGVHVYPAAAVQYRGAVSIVYLRNYMMNSMDRQHYYELANGEIRTAYIDSTDGLCKSAVNNLMGYAYDSGCAQVMLQILPIYTADIFDKEKADELCEKGIYTVYCMDYTIYHNDPDLSFLELYEKDGVSYTAVCSSR